MCTEVKGNLITMALKGTFDVIAHGCNCFCVMGAGIAPQMARAFGADQFAMEKAYLAGEVNKLGTIDYEYRSVHSPKRRPSPTMDGLVSGRDFAVVNAYTQYNYGANHIDGSERPLDYDALKLCLRKMNHTFKGKHIGLPQIGCGLAGGDWDLVSDIIDEELKDCKVTIVIYDNT